MKFAITGTAALLLGTAPVLAGGIERAPQSLAILFEEGNYAELSFGGVDPTVEGVDHPQPAVAYPGGLPTGDVAKGYGFLGLSYKHQFNDNLSGALIVEQPFGADVSYPSLSEGGSMQLGGTSAHVDSVTYTALLRYKFQNNVSLHGGLRGSHASGEVNLQGIAYGAPLPTGLSGYNVTLDDAWGTGWVAGVAWEKPEIGARVSLTYNSPIEHDFDTRENIAPGAVSNTTVKTPRSWTLEGQTGVAADTLVFGSIRWVKWSEFKVDPQVFTQATGGGLVSLENSTTYTLGVGRKFNDTWSGSASFTYEPKGDDLVSPLAPTRGRKGITLAAIYNNGPMKITTGISYTKLGDAQPETSTPDTARAQMSDGDFWGIGIRVGYRF